MDPNRIIQALKGTIDPNMRIAAENELNQVGELMYSTSQTFTMKWLKFVANIACRHGGDLNAITRLQHHR